MNHNNHNHIPFHFEKKRRKEEKFINEKTLNLIPVFTNYLTTYELCPLTNFP